MRAAPQPAIWSAADCAWPPTNPTTIWPPRLFAAVSASSAGFANAPSASTCASTSMVSTLFLRNPGDDFARDLFGRHILHDARLALLFGQRHPAESQSRAVDGRCLGALQRRHHGPHVGHADLRII